METESSRRPFVRSREPDLKKPRLSQDPILAVDRSSNGRPTFMQRPATSSSAVSRRVGDRGGDSESSYSARGGYQHHHLELVNEYKTALAELTFNSKPIITNLTIIAGENLDAAKAIAATICSNIIEVPSEQKLPSLYLLDSIVKNIGRDYIKYFGSKLPEVFCKAYRQVDQPVHSSMKHLFGTWKGVFPPQPLQTIEKELGFAAAANRIPVGTSRLDAPVSRPAHSIHVNPKYLEARQRLQQSSKDKAAGSDPSENVVSSTIDLGGPERTCLGPGRPWADSSSKNSQYTQRELSNVLHTENISGPDADSEYDSDINQSGFEITQGSEKFHGNGRVILSSTQRNGFDPEHGLQNYNLSPKRTPNHGLSSQSTIQMTGNWKNSEEEEFMWDDLNSRAGDHDHAANSVRDRWSLDDSEKISEASVDYLSTEMKDQAVSGNRALSLWSQESHLPERLGSVAGRTIPGLSEGHPIYNGGLSTSAGTNGRTSFQSKVALGSIGSSGYGKSNSHTLGSTVSVVPQRQTLGGSSPPAQSLLYPPDSSSFVGRGVLPVIHHNNTEQDMPHSRTAVESRTSQFSGSPNTDLRTKLGQEALPLPSPDSKRMMSPNAPSSFSVTPHLRQHTSFSQELESENLASDLSNQVPKQFSDSLASTGSFSHDPNPLPLLSSTQSSANSLLAAISGILNINSLSRQSFQTSVALASQANNLPSLPGGGPQTQFAQSSIGMSISSLLGQPAQSVHSQRNDKEPTGSVTPDLSSSTLPQPANVTNANMPVSSLLSSLVSKGLISATKTESTSHISQTPSQPQNHGLETTRSGSSKVSVPLASLPRSMSNTTTELSSAKPVPASTELPLCNQADITSHIGFQFKGDVLRVLHPAVINQLFDDFPHKCGVCEGRLKFQAQVGRHLEWHTLRNQTSNPNKASRVWYAGSVNTLTTDSGMVSANEPSGPQEGGLIKRLECIEPMVPADESQCLCILCGELFEDFYDQGIAQWMFRGAVYATVPCSDAISGNINEVVAQGSLVHEKCISKA